MAPDSKLQFIASLPDCQSAISIGGDGSTRLKLDIPASELSQAVQLILFKGQAIKVTVEPLEN